MMKAEYWIGRLRVGLDAIFLIAMGLFMQWAVGPWSERSGVPALLIYWTANLAIGLGSLSLVTWLVISTIRALKKEKP